MTGPLSYIGGKNRLAKTIISRIPEHTTYVEPFAGGAQVFFQKPPSKVEILNDISNDVVTFFRVCQSHYQELIRYLHYTVSSRTWFEMLERADPTSLTDVQRAARFLILQKSAYAARVFRRNYALNVIQPTHYRPEHVAEMIEAAAERLKNAQIECAPYEQILQRCDRKTTFFYMDPPYYQRKLYDHNFTEEQFVDLAKRLKSLIGKFILSLNDTAAVRQVFSGFKMVPVSLTYSAQKRKGRRYSELLISNFTLPRGVPDLPSAKSAPLSASVHQNQ